MGKGNLQLPKGNFSYTITREGFNSILNEPFVVNESRSIKDTLFQKTFSVQFNISSLSGAISDATVTLDGYPPKITTPFGQAFFVNIGYEKNLQYIIQRNMFTDASGYIDVLNPLIVNISLVSNGNTIITSNHFNIFPNPTSDLLSIESDQPITKVEVVNTLGTVLINSNCSYTNQTSIQMENLNPGIYILIINFENSIPEKALIIKK